MMNWLLPIVPTCQNASFIDGKDTSSSPSTL